MRFGNLSVERTAREYRDKVLVQFRIEEYFVEYAYDSSISDEILNFLMERDRINWMKDLAFKFLSKESSSIELENLTKNYMIS